MNRREALRTIGTGGTVGFVSAVTFATTTQCSPIEAPAAERDPAFEILTIYRRQLDAFNATPRGMTDEDLNELRDQTWGPFFERVNAEPNSMPAATTEAGAVLALRTLLAEQNLHEFDEALLRSALAYFDGRA